MFADELEGEATAAAEAKEKKRDTVSQLTKRMSEIKVSNKITIEAQEADLANKKARKLRKVLREIELIEEKLRNGENVEKEQVEKLKKKHEVMSELVELGEEGVWIELFFFSIF